MKTVFLSLIIASTCFMPNAFAVKSSPDLEIKIPNLLGGSSDIPKFEPTNRVDLSISAPNSVENGYGKQELGRTQSGTTDSIIMGITPAWAENSPEDIERMGKSFTIVKFDKKYNKKMDADLEGFAQRIGKG